MAVQDLKVLARKVVSKPLSRKLAPPSMRDAVLGGTDLKLMESVELPIGIQIAVIAEAQNGDTVCVITGRYFYPTSTNEAERRYLSDIATAYRNHLFVASANTQATSLR